MAFQKCDRLFLLSGAWVSGETLILHEQGTAPSDDHAERHDEEKTGGLLRGDEFAYVTAQRQADGGEIAGLADFARSGPQALKGRAEKVCVLTYA